MSRCPGPRVLVPLIGFLLMAVPLVTSQQRPAAGKPKPAPSGISGVSTAGVYAPVKDAQSRPITAGGFVDGAPVVFTDATESSGLGSFQHRSGTADKKYILELPGSGVALLDYDNDGWLDIYLLNGSTYDAVGSKEPAPRAALFHNNHDGTFTDLTAKAGVANERWGFGVAVGDYNNDGWPDLYLANWGKSRLYRNNGDGTFTDVAEPAGVTVEGWFAAPTFGDYDGDGRLDLFVAGYVDFNMDYPPGSPGSGISSAYCQFRGEPVMCGPRGLPGLGDHLFHNNGDGTFADVSQKAGVSDPGKYYGFAAAFVDVDNDGRLDLVVANDSTPNYLYRNRGDGTFEDLSYASSFALSGNGREQASMGVAVGDYDRDGLVDFYVTNFSDDYNTLYKNEGDANFSDVTFQAGIGEATIPFLGWGTGFLDYDNDGLLDLFVVNGHVYRRVDQLDWGASWAQRSLLFHNLNGARFEVVPAATGSGLAALLTARGAAFGDLFNRGQIDVVVNNLEGPPTLLRNAVKNGNNWATLKLVGGSKSPRDAVGTTAYLTTGGVRQRGDVVSGGSYSSSSDPRLHFGLGSATRVDKLEIRWPSGAQETVIVPAVNRILTVVEGKGVVEEGKP